MRTNKAMRWFFTLSIIIHSFFLFYIARIIVSQTHERNIEVELKNLPAKRFKNIPRPKRRHNIKPKPNSSAKYTHPKELKQFTHIPSPRKIDTKTYTSNIIEPIDLSNFSKIENESSFPLSLSDINNKSNTAGMGADELNFYRQTAWQIINNSMKYPLKARNRGLTGNVQIAFTVSKNGEIKESSIIKSSGHSLLDKSALDTIKNVKLPPLPHIIKEDIFKMSITLTYRLDS